MLHQNELTEAARQINPETAEVDWCWGQILDPYGVRDLPAEERCIGRIYFARAQGGPWVCFDDLPSGAVERLWERMKRRDFDQGDALPWD